MVQTWVAADVSGKALAAGSAEEPAASALPLRSSRTCYLMTAHFEPRPNLVAHSACFRRDKPDGDSVTTARGFDSRADKTVRGCFGVLTLTELRNEVPQWKAD